MQTRRAKDFNGMLRILRETQHALAEATQLLGRTMDTESYLGRERMQLRKEEINQLGRDLATGLVDLEEAVPLDRFAWHTLFVLEVPELENEHPDLRLTRLMRVPWAQKPLRGRARHGPR